MQLENDPRKSLAWGFRAPTSPTPWANKRGTGAKQWAAKTSRQAGETAEQAAGLWCEQVGQLAVGCRLVS